MFLLNWCADYADAHNFLNEVFHPTEPLFQTGWRHSVFGNLIMKAATEVDPQKRKAYYKQAERILCEQEAVVVPVFFSLAHCLVKSRIGGWHHMAIGGQHIRNWFFRKR
jgi:oligopeptide transport system substrate-binding protein